MKRLACIAAICLLGKMAPAQQTPNTLSDQEKKDGWQLLYDGSSTKGWHPYGKPSSGTVWKGNEGSLHLDPTVKSTDQVIATDIVTNEEYTDFDLKLDWKISKNGNSGIIFCVKEDPIYKESYVTGPEIQVLDNDGHPDGKIPKHRASNLYDLIASSSEPVKPVGDWNQAEIILNKGKLDVFLNGVKVVSTTMWDDNWWKLVKESKFKDMPGFSKYKSGRIDLQDHGNEVWYRNIKIKKLS
jgi:hypothetical protein